MIGAVTCLESTLDRRGAPVLRQQAGVDVQGSESGDVQELLGQYVAIRSCDAEVWLQACQLTQEFPLLNVNISLNSDLE